MRRIFVALAACLMVAGPNSAALAHPPEAASEQVVSVESPAPGHTVEWSMRVRLGERELADPAIALVEYSGAATRGPHPLELVLTASGQADTELASGTAADLLDRVVDLGGTAAVGTGDADGWLTVRGTATLPVAAGDEYRGSDATLRFRFSGVVADDLAMTGRSPWDVWLIAAAVAAAGLGAALIGRRRARGAGTRAEEVGS